MHDKSQCQYIKENGRIGVCTVNDEPSLTQQQFAEECDINNIMKRYKDTGEFRHLTSRQGQYADFTEIQDYRAMLDTVRYADEAFMALPAEVRKRFKNDPALLISFLQDTKNRGEAESLGLIDKKTEAPKNDVTINDATKNGVPVNTNAPISGATK